MRKPIEESADLRDFLVSNYDIDDLKIFAKCQEAFMGDYNSISFCIDIFNFFEEEITERWTSLGFVFYRESFYSEKGQKLLSVIKDLSEMIVYEKKNFDYEKAVK